jgi:hypothetical protein
MKKPLERGVVSNLGITHGSQSSLERQAIGGKLFRPLPIPPETQLEGDPPVISRVRFRVSK